MDSILTHKHIHRAIDQAIAQLEIESQDFNANELVDFQRVCAYVRYLLHKHPTRLLSVLYRIDIPEKAFSLACEHAPIGKEVEAIAYLMLAREIKKIEMRERYSQNQFPLEDDLQF